MIFIIVLAFIAMLIGLVVIAGTFIYICGIAMCWLSLTVRKHESEIRTVLNAGDVSESIRQQHRDLGFFRTCRECCRFSEHDLLPQ